MRADLISSSRLAWAKFDNAHPDTVRSAEHLWANPPTITFTQTSSVPQSMHGPTMTTHPHLIRIPDNPWANRASNLIRSPEHPRAHRDNIDPDVIRSQDPWPSMIASTQTSFVQNPKPASYSIGTHSIDWRRQTAQDFVAPSLRAKHQKNETILNCLDTSLRSWGCANCHFRKTSFRLWMAFCTSSCCHAIQLFI